jgi:hypothetical protein
VYEGPGIVACKVGDRYLAHDKRSVFHSPLMC